MKPTPLFPLGRTVATRGAIEALGEIPQAAAGALLARHERGDWGDLEPEDKAANDRAVTGGTRILSAYTTPSGATVWVLTEADRSATTILLPEEY